MPVERPRKYLYRSNQSSVVWITDHFFGTREEKRGGTLTNIEKKMRYLRLLLDKTCKDTLINLELELS